MDIQLLEKQAWNLYHKLSTDYYAQSLADRVRHERLFKVHRNAYFRFLRRQEKLFNYKPDGFAPSSAQPSGVVGQGITL